MEFKDCDTRIDLHRIVIYCDSVPGWTECDVGIRAV